jgi:hypothetical protein
MAAFMSPEEERKNGFIAYGLVAGMVAMLAIVYPLTWFFGTNLIIVLIGLAGGVSLGTAVYRRSALCPVCQTVGCNPTCLVCGQSRDEKHARFRGKSLVCTCNAKPVTIHDGLPGHATANDDGAGGALSNGGYGGLNGLGR